MGGKNELPNNTDAIVPLETRRKNLKVFQAQGLVDPNSIVHDAVEDLGGNIVSAGDEDRIVDEVPGGHEVILPDGTRKDAETGEILVQGPNDD